jgi:hypothetical protein
MTTLKSLTIVAAALAGGTSIAMAQGLPTGGYPPVAGGAGGNPITNPGYYGGGYYATGGYIAAPGYAVPGYVAPPGYAQPGYEGVEEPSEALGHVATTHHRSMYMYVPPHRSSHTHKITPANGGY